MRRRLAHHRFDLSAHCEIAPDGVTATAQHFDFLGYAVDAAPLRLHFLGRQIAWRALHIGEHDIRALRCELERGCAADAFHAAGAGDQNYFAIQMTHVVFPELCLSVPGTVARLFQFVAIQGAWYSS